jgi:ATP-dependent DNA helicase PIF1
MTIWLLVLSGLVILLAAVLAYVLLKQYDDKGSASNTKSLDKSPVKNEEYSKLSTHIGTKPIDLSDVSLSAEQRSVYKLLEDTAENMYITGKAGTGKSVLLQYFVGHTTKRVVALAFTGVAALTIDGQTIHSFFKLGYDVLDPKEITVDYKTKEILRNIDAIIIDEASMVRVDLLEAINAKLQLARGNSLPFGGVQVVLFGDLYQLPPVVTDGQLHRYFNHTYGGSYFFSAPSFNSGNFKMYELNSIFRQKDPEFIELLNEVRHGSKTESVVKALNARQNLDIPKEGVVVLAGTNATVSGINHRKLAQLDGESHEYVAEITGDIKESAFPTEKLLKLKVGAQIMMLKNDQAKPRRWANGTLGIVTKLGADTIRVSINGVEHSVPKETWNKYRYYYDHEARQLDHEITSTFTQFPLRLAWAITIHKSQGQTHERVVIDLTDGAFAHGQTYVALSRCKSLEGLYLDSPIRPQDIIVDQEVIEFMKSTAIVG